MVPSDGTSVLGTNLLGSTFLSSRRARKIEKFKSWLWYTLAVHGDLRELVVVVGVYSQCTGTGGGRTMNSRTASIT